LIFACISRDGIAKILDIGGCSIYTLYSVEVGKTSDVAGENYMIMKKKLDKGIVHYYNFLIKKLYPYKGGEEKSVIANRYHL